MSKIKGFSIIRNYLLEVKKLKKNVTLLTILRKNGLYNSTKIETALIKFFKTRSDNDFVLYGTYIPRKHLNTKG